MTITLRLALNGIAVGAGQRCADAQGRAWEVDNWSVGACKVYVRRPGHTPRAPLVEFNPSDLGLYIGETRGAPIGSIKWAKSEPQRPGFVGRLSLDGQEVTLLHMALRYLRDHGTDKGSPTAREIAALLARLDTLKEV